MIGYTLRRIAQAVLVVLGVTAVTFGLEHLIPGSLARPSSARGPAGPHRGVQPRQRSRPPCHRAVPRLLGRLARGNLGYSYRLNQSVDSLVVHQLPNDLVLVGSALAAALAIAIPMGIAQATHRNRATDHIATAAAFTLYSMPSYWLAIC
jgi:peptide/nickel transport system permease protein